MAKLPKPLPTDYNYCREELGARGKSHVYNEAEREYEERPYVHQEYPKSMYHKDYVHVKEAGKEYPPTADPILVNNQEEAEELGSEWKDSIAAHGIVTAPSADYLAEQRLKKIREAVKPAKKSA